MAEHGRRPDPGEERDGLTWQYLVTHDAQPEHLALTALSWSELRTVLAALPARHQVLLLDSCYSGAGGRSLAPPSTRGELHEPDWSGLVGESRLVLSACQPHEMAYESDELQGGVFTHFIVRGLAGQAAAPGDGVVYADRLHAYVGQLVADLAESRLQGRQHPVLYGPSTPPLPLTFPTTPPPKPTPPDKPLTMAEGLYNTARYQETVDRLLATCRPPGGQRRTACWAAARPGWAGR